MKQRNQEMLIWGLLVFLILSLLLNYVLTNHIQRLHNEIEDMEHLQDILTTHINELETSEAVDSCFVE